MPEFRWSIGKGILKSEGGAPLPEQDISRVGSPMSKSRFWSPFLIGTGMRGERWTPSFGPLSVKTKVGSGFMIQAASSSGCEAAGEQGLILCREDCVLVSADPHAIPQPSGAGRPRVIRAPQRA